MIDFKDRPEAGWNLLLAIALIVAVGSIAALLYWKPPDEALLKRKSDLAHITARVHDRNARLKTSAEAVRRGQWKEGSAMIGAAVLNSLSKAADSCHVQLGGFRSDKAASSALLQQVPFVAVVDGAFPDVMAFVQKVEAPSSKLALNLLQVTSSDAKAGSVTATLGIVAFLPSEVKRSD
jgi:hypothetical protein